MTLYEIALQIASVAHKDQVRKHDQSPYIVHPVMVARILEEQGFSENVVAAGLLHDVIEDSDISEAELRSRVGDEVLDIVLAVSEDKSLVWEERKEQYVGDVVAAGESVWAVSVADKIHNADTFIEHYKKSGPEGWSVFNRGKEKKMWFEELLLSNLRNVWSNDLLDVYEARLEVLKTLVD